MVRALKWRATMPSIASLSPATMNSQKAMPKRPSTIAMTVTGVSTSRPIVIRLGR